MGIDRIRGTMGGDESDVARGFSLAGKGDPEGSRYVGGQTLQTEVSALARGTLRVGILGGLEGYPPHWLFRTPKKAIRTPEACGHKSNV